MNDLIKIDKLKKAQAIFDDFRKDMKTDRDKAGAVQAFEFCYELASKKRYDLFCIAAAL